MLFKQNLVVILLVIYLCASHAEYESDYNLEENVHEGSPCDVKISAALSAMQIKTNSKLDAMDKKLPDNLEEAINRRFDAMDKKILEKIDEATKVQLDILEKKLPERLEKYIENNFSILEKRNHASQEDINDKFHKLHKNLLDKLEEYVDEKFNSLEKHVYRKIDALEKLVPDKTDTNIINHKLDTLKTLQLDSDGSAICALANKTSHKIQEDLNQKINIIGNTILQFQNTTTHFNSDALDTALRNLEGNLNHKWTELKKMVPGIEESMKHKLDALDKKVPEHFEDHINQKFITMEKKITENIIQKIDILDKKFELNIDQKFGDMLNKTLEIKQNYNYTMNTKHHLESKILTILNETGYNLDCKEQRTNTDIYVMPFHRMDEETLTHVAYRNDSAGLSYFEMHLAVKGNNSAIILLSQEAENNINFDLNYAIQIVIFPTNTLLYRARQNVANVKKPNFLSANRYTAIYVKVNNGTLEMGQEGSSSPLIRFSDPGLKSLKYFSFATMINGDVSFLYDCPS